MKLKKSLNTRYFWYTAVLAFLAGIISYTPQFATLFGSPLHTDWLPYYLAAYRLLFPLSVLIAAYRFGMKGGLAVCLVIGPVILSSIFVNSRFANALIDFGDIALSILLSWVVGKQGEMKQRLEETASELKQQSTTLLSEMAERKHAEEQYRLITEHSADIIYRLAIKEEKFTYVSPSTERLLGYTEQEALATRLPDVLTPESYEKQRNELIKDIREGKTDNILELEIIHKDGHIIPVEIHSSLVRGEKGEPIEIVGVARDITERKKMEEQLIMQDRLASIGQLTSGVAHEISNPLTSIVGFSSLLLRRELPEDVKQDVESISGEAQRIAYIVKNLLTFARKQPQEKQPMNVNECIEKVLELRNYQQKVNNIQVNTSFDPVLPQIMGNNSQLLQVFFNVVINAEYFMLQAHKKGSLAVRTEKVGNTVRASFSDDGPGIPREDLRHLFSPFFTTKEAGKGTGLSLSISLGIITEHGGRIWAESESGKGTTFIIELPIYEAPPPETG
jgi:PAS domain S-box-containing protein